MKALRLALILLCVALWSCGDKENFTVEANIEGLNGSSLQVYYEDDGLRDFDVYSQGNKFTFQGHSVTPTLVEIVTLQGDPVATFIAQNGDKITIKGSLMDPLNNTIEGSDAVEAATEFIQANHEALLSGETGKINKIVADFIRQNPTSPVSSQLLLTFYTARDNENEANELMKLIDPKARVQALTQSFIPLIESQLQNDKKTFAQSFVLTKAVYQGKDTLVRFASMNPAGSIMAVVSATRSDTIPHMLADIDKAINTYEIMVGDDSATWRDMVVIDTARWVQAWLPGGVANPVLSPYSVPRLPFFIAIDGGGELAYRGSSLTAALKAIHPEK